jgi:hypothetical protein
MKSRLGYETAQKMGIKQSRFILLLIEIHLM